MAKKFTDFIVDAATDNELAGGFWAIVSKQDFTDDELRDFLKNKGYMITRRELKKVDELHDDAEDLFDFQNDI